MGYGLLTFAREGTQAPVELGKGAPAINFQRFHLIGL